MEDWSYRHIADKSFGLIKLAFYLHGVKYFETFQNFIIILLKRE